MADPVVSLPDSLRKHLKSPAGPLYTDAEELLADAGNPLVTVGDVVTHHVLGAGVTPAVALVDDRTERTAVDPAVSDRIAAATFDHEVTVENPPATLTDELLGALRAALDRPGTTLIEVDGEEDLAAVPAIIAAPDGASIVYGQPGEGMVLVTVDGNAGGGSGTENVDGNRSGSDEKDENGDGDEASIRARMRSLLSAMDGETERALDLIEG